MPSRAHASDWMRTASDEEESNAGQGYSSEEDQRTRVSRPTKRRRLSQSEDDDEDEEDDIGGDISEDEEVQRPVGGRRKQRVASEDEEEEDLDDMELDEDGEEEDEDEDEDEDEAERSLPALGSIPLRKSSKPSTQNLNITDPTQLKRLTPAQLAISKTTLKKTGVIYLSRIPPYMSPPQIRHLLTPFGTINRIFLSPEPPHIYQKRIKNGGNKKRQFTEGWLEFAKKKDAKWCAESLNAQQVGGKKGGWWYDDVWNLKYLSGFKWGDLTEQIANENAARQARLRAEISQATRENKTYIRNVERAKMVENMQAAAKEKRKAADIGDGGATEAAANEKDKIRRTFKQRTAVTKTAKAGEKSKGEKSDAMKKLLSTVF
ncbi:RNA-binding ATPase activator esf2 [Orbilia oligospora]|uniref:18S rRNA factor 2 n=1 Tax=Orbilia oligospora TaxID=2813651 RepID=A0A7C8JKW0_ORBOL|nr:RNA-binding ATPase activator esf2 [Orbilia oligospora]KAF3082612.1 RNA-binding ATPase activator esf2 [Orbilia oligospora]KAF3097697.1 RNA-binding ATPase activator esf2 [Orbilia oligospora]KAF3130082.1 RNA-binding ATPase activator esf2 [Orbilia oligospora]KAF3137709.1 RNA-binding ATPase activator esf2 [Orbilia oligospora]